MKKKFTFYPIAWLAVLALFNVVAFFVPSLPTQEKYTASFWIGYGFITLTLVGQLACSLLALKRDGARRLFYGISLILTSYIGLIVTLVLGGLTMLLSAVPYWVGTVLCSAVLAFNVIAVVKASAAIAEVERTDERLRAQTSFIASLRAQSESLVSRAASDAVRAECTKINEALRYSDPVSSDALASEEAQIALCFRTFSEAVKADDAELCAATAANLSVLLSDRNNKCKLMK